MTTTGRLESQKFSALHWSVALVKSIVLPKPSQAIMHMLLGNDFLHNFMPTAQKCQVQQPASTEVGSRA